MAMGNNDNGWQVMYAALSNAYMVLCKSLLWNRRANDGV